MMSLFLIGSRAYGCHRPNSDWDYMGEDNPENHQYCQSLGLRRVWNIRVPQYFGKVGNRWMDVILVPDIDLRLQVHEELGDMPDMRFLSKEERTQRLRKLRIAYEERRDARL